MKYLIPVLMIIGFIFAITPAYAEGGEPEKPRLFDR